jgi:hypothetical protein
MLSISEGDLVLTASDLYLVALTTIGLGLDTYTVLPGHAGPSDLDHSEVGEGWNADSNPYQDHAETEDTGAPTPPLPINLPSLEAPSLLCLIISPFLVHGSFLSTNLLKPRRRSHWARDIPPVAGRGCLSHCYRFDCCYFACVYLVRVQISLLSLRVILDQPKVLFPCAI